MLIEASRMLIHVLIKLPYPVDRQALMFNFIEGECKKKKKWKYFQDENKLTPIY